MIESALLLHLIVLHPVQLTLPEVVRALSGGSGERDDVERAVSALTRDGLLRRQGSFVLPSHAALRAYELWQVV